MEAFRLANRAMSLQAFHADVLELDQQQLTLDVRVDAARDPAI